MHPDDALIQQAQTDTAAFAALYDRYADRIYGYAYRLTQDDALAQDVTAVAFEKALQNLHQYQPQSSVAAWLYRIAHNSAMSLHRRRKWLAPWQNWLGKTELRATETAVLAQERRQQLHHALRQLSVADRAVITLRFFEELSGSETAEILGCSPANVHVRLHRALKRLQAQLSPFESPEEVLTHVQKQA